MVRWYAPLVLVVAGSVWTLAGEVPPAARGDGTLRVATFNIHKGADAADRYDLQRTIEAIAALDADVVGLQEVLRNHPQFHCDDQPALLAEGLRRATGQRWSYVFVEAWVSADRRCQNDGRGNGVAVEGLALLTRERIVESAYVRLVESRVALLVRTNARPDLPIVVTHLAAYRRNQPHRVAQVAQLLPWLRGRHAAIVVGDLNARPAAPELAPLAAAYVDAWADASARGRAAGVASGSTRPGLEARIDYVFYDAASGVTPESVEVRDLAGADGINVSDHRPVIAAFRRAAASRVRDIALSSSDR